MSRTQRSCATALLVLLLCSLIGCSAPRLPCSLLRSCPAPFVPGPSQSSSTETAGATPSAGHGPGRQLALRGNLNAEAGLTATVLTRLGLDSVTKVSRPAGTIRLQLPVHGSVSVTNSAAGFNAAAVSVDFEIRAGYRRTSTVCRKLAPHAPAHATYCWPIIATATPRAADDAVPPLSKGQSRSLKISGTPGQVTVPKAGADHVARTLGEPDVIIVSTAEVGPHGPFRFKDGCTSMVPAPAAPGTSARAVAVDHVIVGATQPMGCDDISW